MTRRGVECMGCPLKLDPRARRFRLDELADGDTHTHGHAAGYLCPKCARSAIRALAKKKQEHEALREALIVASIAAKAGV